MSEKVLIAFRVTDLSDRVPRSDTSRVCSRCKEHVSLAPSSIKLLQEDKYDILCNRCVDLIDLVKREPALMIPTDEQIQEIVEAMTSQDDEIDKKHPDNSL